MQSNSMKDKKRIKKKCVKNNKKMALKPLTVDTISLIRSLDEQGLENLKDYSYSVYINTSKRLAFVRLLNRIRKGG